MNETTTTASRLVYVDEDGFEMDGTCVPVRLTAAAVANMDYRRSSWWVEKGEEIFTSSLRKQGSAVLVTTRELVEIAGEIDFLIMEWEDEDWDADWTTPAQRQQQRFAWQQVGRSFKTNQKRLAELIAQCQVWETQTKGDSQ